MSVVTKRYLLAEKTIDEADIAELATRQWILEAVAEDLEIKRGLIERAAKYRRRGSIFSTNTSGLPVAQIVAGMPDDDLILHWLGVHQSADYHCAPRAVHRPLHRGP